MPPVVSPPPLNVARFRFVTKKNSLLSRLIRFDTTGPVSHVETVMHYGTIIASQIGTGVARFSIAYAPSDTLQILVNLLMPSRSYTL